MEAKNILKSNYLDILFENKNKDYGAYPLRKFYNQRIKKSLTITLALVLVFAGFQSWRMSKKVGSVKVDYIIECEIPPFKAKEKIEKEKPKEQKIKKLIAQENVSPPKIVPDNQVVKPMPTIDAIDTSLAGNQTIAGTADTGILVTPGLPEAPPSIGNGNANIPVEPEDDSPIYNPSQMPEFPGGMEALKNFMIRHLRQPDDIEEGQIIKVIAKFVVSKTGIIENIEIMHGGREDLDTEVMRVIKKMPTWKPGLQNGLPVNVYYKIPVTFTAMNN